MIDVQQLAAIVGDSHVVTDSDLMVGHTTDWTGRFCGPAVAVVRPGTVEEVAAVLRACHAAGQPVFPHGGVTGLVGAVPSSAGPAPVVLVTTRLKRLREVDQALGQVQVGAGATLAAVQAHARAAGWEYGVDIAARDSATIGGTIATNAGGIRVCAFGMTRAQVVGLEAVLADGTVLSHLTGLPKDNTGYDLAGLFVGSEGTLGVITAATLRLHRPVGPTTLALVAVADYRQAQALVAGAVPVGSRLLAAEVMDRAGTEVVCAVAGLPMPMPEVPWRHLLLIEVSGEQIALPDDAEALLAADCADAARIWTYRERQSEAAALLVDSDDPTRVIQKLDISVPAAAMQRFSDELAQLLAAQPVVTAHSVFGHIADGNLHVEIAGPTVEDDSVTTLVLRLVAAHGGSISAEHGIGQAKAAFLELSRSPAEIATMRAIKAALDPDGLMAPGVIFR
ncbi:MAG: FAD-binding oxidoreductase [Candidatus Nanopelagicales bacterium]